MYSGNHHGFFVFDYFRSVFHLVQFVVCLFFPRRVYVKKSWILFLTFRLHPPMFRLGDPAAFVASSFFGKYMWDGIAAHMYDSSIIVIWMFRARFHLGMFANVIDHICSANAAQIHVLIPYDRKSTYRRHTTVVRHPV